MVLYDLFLMVSLLIGLVWSDQFVFLNIGFFPRLFDTHGEGFIPVERFREILLEVDEDFTEDELDDIIAEVRQIK